MKSQKKGFTVPVFIAIIAVLIIGLGIYAYTASNSGLKTYDNFGITFQYPALWGVPSERLYDKGLGSINFDYSSTSSQTLMVLIEQDTDISGNILPNETLDQMIARFRKNDQYIYDVKDISTNSMNGKELFYENAVTGEPYHVETYFPFQNDSYVTLGADYQAVPQSVFDSIISTLKLDNATVFKQDPTTGMAIYSNDGMRFEYPVKFDTDYAFLTVGTSVEKAVGSKSDTCDPTANALTINGIKFCSTTSGDVGAGQLYTIYAYTTVHGGNTYTISYSVQSSNGCGAYQNSPNLNSPENQRYNECLDFKKNYASIVTEPLKQSISTFTFTN